MVQAAHLTYTTPIAVAENMLLAVKRNQAITSYLTYFQMLTPNQLWAAIVSDTEKKCFWINIYNSICLHYLRLYTQANDHKKIFSLPLFNIANTVLTLDEIEHGILRKNKVKWGLGYITNPFVSTFIKKCSVAQLDYNIHFALNCGVVSCPPITVYNTNDIASQLKYNAIHYLQQECVLEHNHESIVLPSLIQWYQGDFVSNKQIINMLIQYGIIPKHTSPKLLYKKYNWELYLNNFLS